MINPPECLTNIKLMKKSNYAELYSQVINYSPYRCSAVPPDASQASTSSQPSFEGTLTRVRDARPMRALLPNAQKSRDFNKRHSRRRRRIEPKCD